MVQQKYALITGASSGIGYQLAISLSKKGYKVFGCAPESNVLEMKKLSEEYGVVAFACDITNIEDIKKAVQIIGEQTGGRLDILYNNAGISYGGPAVEMPDDHLVRIFNVNTIGHILMTKYMIDFVIAAKGTILFTSSVAAKIPLSWAGPYCATKAAIDQYALVLRTEMKPFGVRVHSVITGGVDTGLLDKIDLDRNAAGSRYAVDGLYESMWSLRNMSRNKRTNMSPEKYANRIVTRLVSTRDIGFNIYEGALAYTLAWCRKWVPLFLLEWGNSFHFNQLRVLRNLKRKVDQAKKDK